MLHPNRPPPLPTCLQVCSEAGHEEGLGQAPGQRLWEDIKGDPEEMETLSPSPVTQAGRSLGPFCSTCPEVPDATGRGQPPCTSSRRRGRARAAVQAGAKEVNPGTLQFQMKALSFQTPWDLPPQLLSLPASSLSRKLLGSADTPTHQDSSRGQGRAGPHQLVDCCPMSAL